MDLIIPDWNAPSNIGAFSTTRCGGVSAAPYDDGAGGGGLNLGMHVGDNVDDVFRNRTLLAGFLPSEPVWLTQVHGTHVLDAADAVANPEADAIVSSVRGAICAIQTADCLPVLFCAVDGTVVGAAHAGWRGLAHGVLENTVAAMRNKGADEIIAWLGPAIGPAQFEVGADVRDAFAAHDPVAAMAFSALPNHPGKYHADIYSLARHRLSLIGVMHCFGGSLCTVTDGAQFYSYRRDRTTGRMASLIWLK